MTREQFEAWSNACKPRVGDTVTYGGRQSIVTSVEGNLCWTRPPGATESAPFIWRFENGRTLNALHDWPGKQEEPLEAWNPRFVEYARAHQRSPDAQLEADKAEWSGCMTGFILWMRERHGEAFKQIPHAYIRGGGLVNHKLFDIWLHQRVNEILKAKEQ